MEENKKTFYAITYNKNYRKNAKMKRGDYADVIMTLQDHCELVSYAFEYGDIQERLHLHALLLITDEELMIIQQYDKFKHKGFCFKMVECANHKGWLNYMAKEKSFFTG